MMVRAGIACRVVGRQKPIATVTSTPARSLSVSPRVRINFTAPAASCHLINPTRATMSLRTPSVLAAFNPDKAAYPTIETVGKLLASDKIKKVVVLAGAGVSTASGIPDFRSPDTGLYANLAKYKLPYPEAIFEIGYFQSTPQPFFTLSKELYPGNFHPTLTHYFLRLLNEKGKLLRVFTQNIDTLDRLAGLPAERIVEAHGSFATSRCIKCGTEVDGEWMKEKCLKGDIARCAEERCKKRTGGKGGLVKPDIVFFGEGLPNRFFERLGDLKEADLLITMGTSLQVQPFASLIDRVPSSCPRLLINLERVGDIGSEDSSSSSSGGLSSYFPLRESGFDFDGLSLRDKSDKRAIRDVFFQGKTDEGALKLAGICGWEEELREIWAREKKVFDEQKAGAGASLRAEEQPTGKTSAAPLPAAEAEADKVAKEVSQAAEKSQPTEKTDGQGSDAGEGLAEQVSKLSVSQAGSSEAEKKLSQQGEAGRKTEDRKPSL